MADVIEEGLVLELDGKFWGKKYEDGQCTEYGWTDIKKADLSNPKFCHKPSDMTYRDSPDITEMNKGRLIMIKRITTYDLLGD